MTFIATALEPSPFRCQYNTTGDQGEENPIKTFPLRPISFFVFYHT